MTDDTEIIATLCGEFGRVELTQSALRKPRSFCAVFCITLQSKGTAHD